MGWYAARVPNRLAGAKEKDRQRAYGTQLRDPALLPDHHCRRPDHTDGGGPLSFTLFTTPRTLQRRAPELLRVTHKLGYA